MAEETFADLGRVEAISRLYEGTPFKPFRSSWFETSGKSFVTTHSRTFIEGIDFDLIYFPLKHLGYKCVVGVTGELYAEFSHPKTMDIRLGPVSTLEEARGSCPHPEESLFCLVAREEGSFPCLVGKEFPAFPLNLKRRRSPQERQ